MALDLRWRTVVVTGAATGLGREVALRFGRLGAGVVAVDDDLAGIEDTAREVRACRVPAWAVQADVRRGDDLALLDGRLRDLGGADVLVTASDGAGPLVELFLDALPGRRGRRDQRGAVVLLGPGAPALVAALTGSAAAPQVAAHARVTAVLSTGPGAAATVVDLAARGDHGAVVGLSPAAPGEPPG